MEGWWDAGERGCVASGYTISETSLSRTGGLSFSAFIEVFCYARLSGDLPVVGHSESSRDIEIQIPER